jgi:hypothetical protein
MPVAGTRDVLDLAADAPTMVGLDTEPLTLERFDVLQVMYEIESAPIAEMLPPAFNPTIPATLTWVVFAGESPDWGAFRLAQTRLGCRAGVRPRGFLLSSFCDNDAAAEALASRWGYRVEPGDVRLTRYHDRVVASVARDGASILEVSLLDPEPISGGDVQYVATMNLAETPRGLRLVQVDPEYTFHKAERGKPSLASFEAAAWGDARVRPCWPVSASITVADITLPKLRYVCRPDVPALSGTEAL